MILLWRILRGLPMTRQGVDSRKQSMKQPTARRSGGATPPRRNNTGGPGMDVLALWRVLDLAFEVFVAAVTVATISVTHSERE